MQVRLLLIVTLVQLAGLAYADPNVPRWLGAGVQDSSLRSTTISRVFATEAVATSGSIRFAPISAGMKILLDGQVVAAAEPYAPIGEITLETRIGAGNHRLVIEIDEVDGPSAVFLEMRLVLEDGKSQRIVTDDKWRLPSGDPAQDLGEIDQQLRIPASRRVGVDVVDNYEQWKQALGTNHVTDPASFHIAPGFEIQQIRSARLDEGSWVSLAFDRQGRAVIAKESAGLLRMTLADSGDEIAKVESFAETLKECRGLAFIEDDLYANANNSRALYRLRIRGENFDDPQLVFASSGGVGHGRNDLAIGPAGKLYSIHGDAVDLPDDVIDYTSPFRAARRGIKTSEGHLLKIDPESGKAEILAAGLRNPFGIDFNRDGEPFTYDADAEYDMGAPWYRPTRVHHLVVGGDYGWRGVTKSWPPYYPDHPDNARPGLDIGKGSPTAVKFGTRSNFPKRYRDSLFILDWAYGRIACVHMVPRGSSYLMNAETFLRGRPLNVTDLGFSSDGDLYFVTGGRKTQSALYRVRHVGPDDQAEEKPAFQLARDAFATESRSRRHQLQRWLAEPMERKRMEQAWDTLRDDDPHLRHAARNVLERFPIELWRQRSLTEADPRVATQTLLALARSFHHRPAGEGDKLRDSILMRLNQLLPTIDSPTDQHTALYTYSLCLREIDRVDTTTKSATKRMLAREYPCRDINSYPMNRLLSEMLVQLDSDDVVEKTIRLLTATTDQAEQLHYLFELRQAQSGWTLQSRRDFFAGLLQAEHYLGGAGMKDFLGRIREDAVAMLEEPERLALASLVDREQTSAEVEEVQREFVREWTVDDLLESIEKEWPVASPDRGADVFASASCSKCHRFGSLGTMIGPDLSAASRRFSRRDLLVSMIEPSQAIAENYRSLQIVTSEGKTFVGQATLGGDYRSPVLRLAIDPANPFKTIEIQKTDIESQSESEVSWMPKGLLDTFTKAEILDLLAYLLAGP